MSTVISGTVSLQQNFSLALVYLLTNIISEFSLNHDDHFLYSLKIFKDLQNLEAEKMVHYGDFPCLLCLSGYIC